MNRDSKTVLLIAVVFILASVGFFILDRMVIFSGNRIKGPDYYTTTFQRMNERDSHTLELREGDTLWVEFSVTRGRADLLIGIDGEEPIYRGNDIASGAFSLTVPEDGLYRITLKAKHAAGSVDVRLDRSGSGGP